MRKKHGRRSPAWGKLLAIAAVIAALAAAWRYTPLSEYVTAERITGWARAIRGWSWAPVVVMCLYTPAAFLMFPRPLLTLMTVIAFGPWLGFAYGMAGILLSALATYYAGRLLPEKTVQRLAGDKLDDVVKALRRHGLMAMLAVRIIPVAPFAVEGIIAGAVSIKVWEYTLGTFLGMLPGVLATSVFGGQLTAALEDPSTINWWIVGGVVLAMVALTWYVKRWFSAQSA
ncbi:MAG TPA: TVP38/TMEM64 family protein [Burkholderiales bacterium]|nr:TVP38/TMEM64 family protein [Burkholderiales bacterium]